MRGRGGENDRFVLNTLPHARPRAHHYPFEFHPPPAPPPAPSPPRLRLRSSTWVVAFHSPAFKRMEFAGVSPVKKSWNSRALRFDWKTVSSTRPPNLRRMVYTLANRCANEVN